MSFIAELQSALEKMDSIDNGVNGSHLIFLREMLGLRNQKEWRILLEKNDATEELLDAIKMTIADVKVTAEKSAEWIGKVEKMDPVEGSGELYV